MSGQQGCRRRPAEPDPPLLRNGCHTHVLAEGAVSFLKNLFRGKTTQPKARVRVCVECGKPVDDHANWCAILRTQQEMELKRAQRETAGQ